MSNDTTTPSAPATGDGAASIPLEPKLQKVVSGAHDTIDHIAERAAPHVQRLESGLEEANAKLHRGVDQAKVQANVWAEDLRGTVRRNPLGALICAFGLGWLVARLTH